MKQFYQVIRTTDEFIEGQLLTAAEAERHQVSAADLLPVEVNAKHVFWAYGARFGVGECPLC